MRLIEIASNSQFETLRFSNRKACDVDAILLCSRAYAWQPWVAVLLTNRVSESSSVLPNQHCSIQLRKQKARERVGLWRLQDQIDSKLKLEKNVCNFSFEMTGNEQKGNLQELRHNAYQELPYRFCFQYWRIKDTFLDDCISTWTLSYTFYLPNRLIWNKFIMHVRYSLFRRPHTHASHTRSSLPHAARIPRHGRAVHTCSTNCAFTPPPARASKFALAALPTTL